MDAIKFNEACKELAPKIWVGENEAREKLAKLTISYAEQMSRFHFLRHSPHRQDFDQEDVAILSANNFINAVEHHREENPISNYAGYLSHIVSNDFKTMQRGQRHEVSEGSAKAHHPGNDWLESMAVKSHSFAGSIGESDQGQKTNAWDSELEQYLCAAFSQLNETYRPLAEICYFKTDYMQEVKKVFPDVPSGTIKRRTMKMKQHVLGELAQIRDEYLSDKRVADAEVVQDTMNMALRIADKHAHAGSVRH